MDPSPLTTKHPQQDLLLVKDNLAAYFREEIISGRFAPGEKIVEVKWSKLLKISQTSVREALNILLAEGFVQKGSGRTAQVTRLSDEDITHSYELRAVLEGYAARVVAQKKMALGELEQTLSDMRSAIECHNLRAFYERDLQFHLQLAEKTGNAMLVQGLKRIIQPLFAFVVIRVQGARTENDQWVRSLEQHERMIEALKTHDPVFAERLVTQTVSTFHEMTNIVVDSTR
jgi:DNA-binding GntR family transcriptional regulator